MSLVTLKEILSVARTKHYAIGAFEVWNMESVQAVVSAAEEQGMPVILQAGAGEGDYAELQTLSLLAKYYAERAKVPVVIHLDHGDSFENIMRFIHNGFSSVMLDVSHLPFAENVAATRQVVEVAHACGVSVEGELGRIGGAESDINVSQKQICLTDPDEAARFVDQTGVDALAVAIGTVHGFYTGEPVIRLDILEKIAEKVSVPLVLHGGSGTPDVAVQKAISRGIAKVNVCTEFMAAFMDTFVAERNDPEFLYNVDGIFKKPRQAAKAVISKKIQLFSGK